MAGYKHPSGPTLSGHPACGPGKIFDHASQRCISVMAFNKKNKKDPFGRKNPPQSVRGAM